MKTVVNFCGNCPFLYSHYDDFSTGYSTLDICVLSEFLKYEEYIVSKHNNTGFNEDSKTPEWCPLKNEKLEIVFNEFSNARLEEIEEVKENIKKLEDDMNQDDEINEEKEKEYQDLSKKYEDLQKSEETPYYEKETEDDFNIQIDKVKEQISLLEEAGDKLKTLFENLDNINNLDENNLDNLTNLLKDLEDENN